MILWIAEDGIPHVALDLDSSIIEATKDGEASVYRWDDLKGEYQEFDGAQWVTVDN